MEQKKILITAALPYANGPLHIGHVAGCYLPADIYARFQRSRGHAVQFVCGTDEHGVPITIRAMKEDTTPQAIVDKYHTLIRDSFDSMKISFDIFSRTSTDLHRTTSQAFFKKLYDDGLFEEKESEQYYDEVKGTFLADRYIIGTCPVCSNTNAYGDQCEQCGTSLSPEQLIHPRSALSDATPVKRTTKHWYFPLQDYEPYLKEWIVEGKKDEWKNNVYGQCKSWLDAGLQPRAMTRDSSWGVPVPIEGADGKVLYVWFDAPIGYITATKELLPNHWQDYWMSDDTKLVHFIGKDNIVFHCIIFPAMLRAHGGFVLPDNVPANEFLNIEGQKVSTSRNWAIWIHEFVQEMPDMVDAMRFVLCANAPENKDNDFTWKDFQQRHNSELVDIYGNFVNRVMVLTHKLCGGRVPYYKADTISDIDRAMIQDIQKAVDDIASCIESYKFRDAIFLVIDLARKGNKYLQDIAPWTLAKTEESRAAHQQTIDNCMHISLQLLANLSIVSYPFMPDTSDKIRHMLKVVPKITEWSNAGRMDLLKENYPLRAPELIFRKIEDKEMDEQRAKLASNVPTANSGITDSNDNLPSELTPIAENIVIDDFAKIDLRVGTILEATKVPKADKLLQLSIDLGLEVRTILSGIALDFSPEEIVGKKVVVVANLAPRKMRGIESAGMILMSQDAAGKLVFVSPESTAINGAVVR